jgi:hypothetical protein
MPSLPENKRRLEESRVPRFYAAKDMGWLCMLKVAKVKRLFPHNRMALWQRGSGFTRDRRLSFASSSRATARNGPQVGGSPTNMNCRTDYRSRSMSSAS